MRMSTANASIRRRKLWLGALTVLLHALVFRWFGDQLGRVPDRFKHAEPAPLIAELVPLAPAAAPAPVDPPQPAFTPPPPPPPVALDPLPPPSGAATPPAIDAPPTDGAVVAGPDAAGGPAGQESPGTGAADVQSQHDAAAPDAVAAAPVPPPEPQAPAQPAAAPWRRYKVDIPPSSDITLDVARVDGDGAKWSGRQSMSWTVTPSGYRIQVEAGVRIVFANVNLLTLTSEGTIDADGFAPVLLTGKRRGKSMTATHFNRADGTLTFSATTSKYPLAPGSQDSASVPLQLTAIARGDPKQLSGNIDILVGEDREAAVYTFTVAGQEALDTPLGRLDTWHLVRAPKAGAYSARLDIWLAPAQGWYPVQIRVAEHNGAVTTQLVNKIVIKHAGS